MSKLPESMSNAEKVACFLDKAGVFYFATTDGDQPRVRAYSYFIFKDDKIYFATGAFKNVFRQLQENPKVEVFARIGMQFLRYDGMAKVVEDDAELQKQIRREATHMAGIYAENGWNFGFFTLENGHAEIRESLYPVEEFDV